jgi:RHH-type proline utilization regulon transcriptional repressor/proline dehydrogenase/delta 1-pyrroline-5-carboxylate dehydrogenase
MNRTLHAGKAVEPRVLEAGLDLLKKARTCATEKPGSGQWLDSFLVRLMRNEHFLVQALRFIDVLPSLEDDRELVRHLQEYFGKEALTLPRAAEWGIRHAPTGAASHLIAPTIRMAVQSLARRFIGGADITEASGTLAHLRRLNMATSLDLLGETVVSEAEAEDYKNRYLELISCLAPQVRRWPEHKLLDHVSNRPSPRLNLSIKVSSLYSQLSPVDPEGGSEAIKKRLRPILAAARNNGAFIFLDMEHYDYKNIILRVFREILLEPEFRTWPDAGIALQCYLKDTESDLNDLIDWARDRGTPVTVRLVRGAYWDLETVIAAREGWDSPVWEEKWLTDACYERCLRVLFNSHPHIEAAIATHNVRSIALAMVYAGDHGLDPGSFEFQMLYGMADNLKEVIRAEGYRLRVYVPYGELIPGMAYLVRRLLENSTSQSFLRLAFMEEIPDEVLLAKPAPAGKADTKARHQTPSSTFTNEPVHRFTEAMERESFRSAIEAVRRKLGEDYALLIRGREVWTDDRIVSRNPADPAEMVGRVSAAGTKQADAAIEASLKALPEWRSLPATDRADILLRAAENLHGRRDEFAAWEVLEAGKTWPEANADVTEAIDYLRYYAHESMRLADGINFDVSGETNHYFYQPRGIVLVISPWNFPLAILTGMLSAALATGNVAVIKPSSQTPVIAAKLVELLLDAGLPANVVHYLPGSGEVLGNYLVRHPAVNLIAFTGSQDVGCRINELAARLTPGQTHIKRVIAEMGGKNAIIIDDDADLDEAVSGVIASAFGYAGQKCSACSRVITVGRIYPHFLERLMEAAKSLRIGPPEQPGTFVGPVISAQARDRILHAIHEGKASAKVALEIDTRDFTQGYYVGPVIFTHAKPDSRLAQEEIFGPVLTILEAEDFQEAIQIANRSHYALTGGVFSRSPEHLARASQEFHVGNLYLNRKITGAIVGRQPFGGFRLSGVGSKAGGPDYLLQFVEPRTLTENSLRRGFAPSTNIRGTLLSRETTPGGDHER